MMMQEGHNPVVAPLFAFHAPRVGFSVPWKFITKPHSLWLDFQTTHLERSGPRHVSTS
jgi:hypothetical protein